MKKIISCLVILIVTCSLVACGSTEKAQPRAELQLSQMRAIGELAGIECFYHNVAKYDKKDAVGMLWWKKDKKLWIEYSGIVKLGIDITKLDMQVDNEMVSITLPQVKVLSAKIDDKTLTKESFFKDADTAEISAEEQTAAIKDAQAKMYESASQDSALTMRAQQQIEKLLTEYVTNLGELLGVEYNITWNYLQNEETQQS